MNKNPFVSYPQHQPQPGPQPPLPPGPPPAQPAQPYWPQQPIQWTPPADQTALYANYGYGPQNNWQRQHHFYPPPQPQPQPQPPPGYNPYQPAPVYPQPYVQKPPPYQPQQQQQQPPIPLFVHPPVQPVQHQPSRPIHNPPAQHLPPAKRPRFDGSQNGHRNPPTQPQLNPMLPRGAAPSRAAPQRLGLPGRTGRGGSMSNNNKPPMSGRGGGRGGSFTGTGRGGGLALRGHGSRGNFGNRRGGGSFTGPFQGMRGRGQSHHNVGRNRHEPPKDSTISGYGNGGKREENRRTLTDFKIIGLEIPDLEWQWGTVPTLKIESEQDTSSQLESSAQDDPSKVEPNSPPSRIRIYFHTPVTPDDSHPISHPPLSTIPSDSRKGKRKKLEDDSEAEDGARERPPPQMSDDLSSVAPSVSESAGEDWLMAAIAESEKTESEHADVEDEDDPPADSVQLADNASEGVVEDFLHGNDVSEEADHHVSDSLEVVDPPPHLNGATASEAVVNSFDPPPKDAEPEAVQAESSNLPEISVSNSQTDFNESSAVVDETSADHIGSQSQVLETTPEPELQPAPSRQPTLLDINTTDSFLGVHDSSDLIHTQQDQDHLPEPPASASSASAYGDSKADIRTPSANRLSVSYAGGEKRLVIDAEVVESLKVFREEGRIEIRMVVTGEELADLKGILVEGVDAVTKSYTRLQSLSGHAETDSTVPPFAKLSLPSTITLTAYLDTSKPLSEPRWVKTGDTAEWLRSIFGRMFWPAGQAAEGWEKRIVVDDPDPPPTIWTVLDGWASSSPVGTPAERQRFLKTHMTETDNILEILLRLVRGERATPHSAAQTSLSNIAGPLFSALSPGSAHGNQQTHVSLAVLAIFRMTIEYAKKAVGDNGKIEVEERVGDIIRCIPSHLIHKSVDGIFKEWRQVKQ